MNIVFLVGGVVVVAAEVAAVVFVVDSLVDGLFLLRWFFGDEFKLLVVGPLSDNDLVVGSFLIKTTFSSDATIAEFDAQLVSII